MKNKNKDRLETKRMKGHDTGFVNTFKDKKKKFAPFYEDDLKDFIDRIRQDERERFEKIVDEWEEELAFKQGEIDKGYYIVKIGDIKELKQKIDKEKEEE